MRIVDLQIEHWRNFRNVSLSLPEDSTLICLIGENGTGKTNILELISAAAHRFGISPGVEIARGDPFSEVHSFSLAIKISEQLENLLPAGELQGFQERGINWNGILRLSSRRSEDGTSTEVLIADGEGDPNALRDIAHRIRDQLRQKRETNYLSLDADRSYPPLNIHPQHYAEALGRDWEEPQFRKQRAFVATRTMYDEWTKYFLARETQEATKLHQEMRRAKERNLPPPEFVDCFEAYKASVQKVLPHLKFVGVDIPHRTLVFDSSGLELKFTNLSGGEREISFIIGQIERFQLRNGVLLIDEPELHLNPDLLRNWVAYLRDTIVTGQIWISTHSLEAVEAAGPESTIVLERTSDTRIVEVASSLQDRPVLSVLSAAVGSPAFSLSRLHFVYVEGDRQGREKERFYSLYGDSRFVRIIEGGGCAEVVKKLAAIRELAEDADEQIHVGGVIDRDFRSQERLDELARRTPVFVLACHEVENLFLHPEALQLIADRSGLVVNANEVIQEMADRFAGLWILGHTLERSMIIDESTKALRQLAGAINWAAFEADREGVVRRLVAGAFDGSNASFPEFCDEIRRSVEEYAVVRNSPHLWKLCLGKEVLGVLPGAVGMRSADVIQNNVLKIWEDGDVDVPCEVAELREYINTIT